MPIPDEAVLRVTRFELYPPEDPTVYAVAVTLTLPNERATSAGTNVPLSEADGLTNEEIRDAAIQDMHDTLETWADAHKDAPSFIGDPEDWGNVSGRLIMEWAVGYYWGSEADYDAYVDGGGTNPHGGDQSRYQGTVYDVVQPHSSDAPNWNPVDSPALWTEAT